MNYEEWQLVHLFKTSGIWGVQYGHYFLAFSSSDHPKNIQKPFPKKTYDDHHIDHIPRYCLPFGGRRRLVRREHPTARGGAGRASGAFDGRGAGGVAMVRCGAPCFLMKNMGKGWKRCLGHCRWTPHWIHLKVWWRVLASDFMTCLQENGLLDCLLSYDWSTAVTLVPALAQHLADMAAWYIKCMEESLDMWQCLRGF